MQTVTIDTYARSRSRRRSLSVPWRWIRLKRVWVPLAVVVVLLVAISAFAYTRYLAIRGQVDVVVTQGRLVKDAADAQNLPLLAESLPQLQAEIVGLRQQVETVGFVGALPVVGDYYRDGQHAFAAADAGLAGGQVLVDALNPYAEVLGMQGKAEAGTSNEQKIAELILLMPTIIPALEESQSHFAALKTEMAKIDVDRYPDTFRGVAVKDSLRQAQDGVAMLEGAIRDSRPLLEVLPSVLGAAESKHYLVIFQNDKELRPTGGFMTSVAYLTFTKGQFEVSDTNDIYSIDKERDILPAPKPIIQYLKVPRWQLRDANFSPDFVQSMDDFRVFYDRYGNKPIDGVIAVDTQLVEALMTLTGPLSVEGYDEPFSAETITVNGTKVSQVVYQLELISQKLDLGQDNRKGILGDLMNVMVDKLMSEPASRWPEYLELLQQQGREKSVLLQFDDVAAQKVAEDRNFAGRIVEQPIGEDYLHISDANLAGLKSNFYLTQTTRQDVTVQPDGSLRKKLTITYRNTGKFDGWINATARNYTRVYVPAGSKLLASSGGEQRVTTSTDLNKTVFDNFVTVKPLGEAVLTFEYASPTSLTGEYRGTVQKQPGAQNWTYTTTVNGGSPIETVLDGDQRLVVPR